VDNETTLYAAIGATVAGAVAWMSKFFIGRIMERLDTLEHKVGHVREHCIKSDALHHVEVRLLEAIHANSEEIKTRMARTDSRIDELFRDHNVR
jgi:hypothetical protein